MKEYDEPSVQYIINSIYDYIRGVEKSNPWCYENEGVEIEYGDWPIKLENIINEKTLRFDSDKTELQWTIRIDITGGDSYAGVNPPF